MVLGAAPSAIVRTIGTNFRRTFKIQIIWLLSKAKMMGNTRQTFPASLLHYTIARSHIAKNLEPLPSNQGIA